jgi:importin subunit alpha-6/7
VVQPASLPLLRALAWSLSAMYKHWPQPRLSMIVPALPAFVSVLSQDDADSLSDVGWALSYISGGGDLQRIQALVDAGVVTCLVEALARAINNEAIVLPILRVLGNVASGDELQTQAVVDARVLPVVAALLSPSAAASKRICREACWLLSNLAAGTAAQLSMLLTTPNSLTGVLAQASAQSDLRVRREAAWVLCNLTVTGQPSHVEHLVNAGTISALCGLLLVEDVEIVLQAMGALDRILDLSTQAENHLKDTKMKKGKGKGYNRSKEGHEGVHVAESCGGIELQLQYKRLFADIGGVEKLENLQEHENEQVYHCSVRIIVSHFGGIEEISSARDHSQYYTDGDGEWA